MKPDTYAIGMFGMDEESGESKDATEIPVKLEASAKASLELKGEIPSDALGRALHAILDLFSPLTEGMGLWGQNIRIQRLEALEKLGKRVQDITPEGEALQPVEPKVFVPLLENASLESVDDQEMIDTWAALLLSASLHPRPEHARFVGILKELAPEHARLFNEIMTSGADWGDREEEWSSATEMTRDEVVKHLISIGVQAKVEDVYERVDAIFDRQGLGLASFSISPDKNNAPVDSSGRTIGGYDGSLLKARAETEHKFDVPIAVLDSLGLVRSIEVIFERDKGVSIAAHLAVVTRFGIAFFNATNIAEPS